MIVYHSNINISMCCLKDKSMTPTHWQTLRLIRQIVEIL